MSSAYNLLFFPPRARGLSKQLGDILPSDVPDRRMTSRVWSNLTHRSLSVTYRKAFEVTYSSSFPQNAIKFFSICQFMFEIPQYSIIATRLRCRREMAYLVGLPMTDIIIAYRAGRGERLSQGDTIRTTLCFLIARTPGT